MIKKFAKVNSEIKRAISDQKPIVVLESTIISHGMPYPQNLETALEVQDIVRSNGAIPATVGVINGILKVGLTDLEINVLATSSKAIKITKSNLHSILMRKQTGSTTVAATLVACKIFGLEFFATGGIGGVHRNIHELDISADIFELSMGSSTVVCSGAKAILDVPKTIEVLEAFGVPVIVYKKNQIPNFWSQESGIEASIVSSDINEIVSMHNIRKSLKLNGCQLILNPIDKKFEIQREIIEPIIKKALKIAEQKKIKGKEVTPFLLSQITQESGGKSLTTNIELIKANAALTAKIAKRACKKVK